MKKYLKPALWTLLGLFVLIQFIRPAKNQSGEQSQDISLQYPIPEAVLSILKTACYDCHSNHTRYPWYAEVQPVAWWLDNHVKEGKRELNFSAFTGRRIAVQNKKFEEIIEMVKEGEMPLNSYTWIHRDAILTDDQRVQLTGWAQAMQDSIRAKYPADSLVLKRR